MWISPRALPLALAATLTLAPPVPAQVADTVAAEEVEPLFTQKDAWFATGFFLGTALLAPLDVVVAEAIQDSVLQDNSFVREVADGFRVMGFPGVTLVSGGLFAAGHLLGRPGLADVGLHTTEAVLLAEAVTITGKALVGRARPKLDTDDPFNLDLGRGFTHDDYQSFPSGHSTAAFATAAALTHEIAHRWPDAKLLAGSLLYGGAALVAVSRLYHNEHWASDVMMGAAIGSFGGWKVVAYNHSHPDNPLNRWLLPRALPDGAGRLRLVWSVPLPASS